MRRFLLLVCALSVGTVACAEQNALQLFAEEYLRSKHLPPPFALSSRLKTVKGEHAIEFRFTNISKVPLSIRQCYLPWGQDATIRLWAITTEGKSIPRVYSGEPYGQYVTIEPDKALQGDFFLSTIFPWDSLPRDKDIVLMWVYQMPIRDKEFEEWPTATGLVVVPKAK